MLMCSRPPHPNSICAFDRMHASSIGSYLQGCDYIMYANLMSATGGLEYKRNNILHSLSNISNAATICNYANAEHATLTIQ